MDENKKKNLINEKITGRRLTPARIVRFAVIAALCGAVFGVSASLVRNYTDRQQQLAAESREAAESLAAHQAAESRAAAESLAARQAAESRAAAESLAARQAAEQASVGAGDENVSDGRADESADTTTDTETQSAGNDTAYSEKAPDNGDGSGADDSDESSDDGAAASDALPIFRDEADFNSYMLSLMSEAAGLADHFLVAVTSTAQTSTWFENDAERTEYYSGVILSTDEKEILILTTCTDTDQKQLRVSFPDGSTADAKVRQVSRTDGLSVLSVDIAAEGERGTAAANDTAQGASRTASGANGTAQGSSRTTSGTESTLPGTDRTASGTDNTLPGTGRTSSGANDTESDTGRTTTGTNRTTSGTNSGSAAAGGASASADQKGADTGKNPAETGSNAASAVSAETLETIAPVEYADTDLLSNGSRIIAVGAPLGVIGSCAFGNIGYIADTEAEMDCDLRILYSEITSNSLIGTFLMDYDGKLIGIATPKESEIGASPELTRIVSMSSLESIVSGLMEGVKKASLGIKGITVDADGKYGNVPEGIYVSNVYQDSPAYTAGIRRGDVIVGITDGGIRRSIKDMDTLTRILFRSRPGDQVTVTVMRDSVNDEYRELDFELTFGERG